MKQFIFLSLLFISVTDLEAKTYICAAVYCDPKGQESMFPNTHSVLKSSTTGFQRIYWECATNMFASSAKNNNDAEHLIFSNKTAVPEPYDKLLKEFGVKLVTLPLAHVAPDGWHHKYKNSVYTLDIIQYLAARLDHDDVALILDADTIWLSSCKQLESDIKKNGALVFSISYDDSHDINGITLQGMKPIFQDLLQKPVDKPIRVAGGELVAATGAFLKKIAAQVDPLWKTMLNRFENKKPIFYTEEHFLTFIYYKLNLSCDASKHIQRILTYDANSKQVTQKELACSIWHLPAEKQKGLKKIYDLVENKNSDFWKTELGTPFKTFCAKACDLRIVT